MTKVEFGRMDCVLHRVCFLRLGVSATDNLPFLVASFTVEKQTDSRKFSTKFMND